MRSVLADPIFMKHAGRFVWLELNYDKTENQPLLEKYAARGVPVLLVLDPRTEQVLRRFQDDTTAAALDRFFSAAAAPAAPTPTQELAARVAALAASGEIESCANLATKEAPAMERALPFGDVVLNGLSCAYRGRGTPWARAALAALEPPAREAADLATLPLDSRYQLFELRIAAHEQTGDLAGAKRIAGEWLARIERDDQIGAQTPDSRIMRDESRVRAVRKGAAASRALPALVATERALPSEYTACGRVAEVANLAGQTELALAAATRGLALAPLPGGRVRLLAERATALLEKHDLPGARRALDEADASAGAIPLAGSRKWMQDRLAQLRGKLP